MKKPSILLGILLGFALPFSAQASPDHPSTKERKTKTPSRLVVRAPRQEHRVVYYITSNTVAGSRIPTVVRRYQGHNEALNGGFLPNRFFTASDPGGTASTSVGGALAQLDPAITLH